jgi:hypothetical protein
VQLTHQKKITELSSVTLDRKMIVGGKPTGLQPAFLLKKNDIFNQKQLLMGHQKLLLIIKTPF